MAGLVINYYFCNKMNPTRQVELRIKRNTSEVTESQKSRSPVSVCVITGELQKHSRSLSRRFCKAVALLKLFLHSSGAS